MFGAIVFLSALALAHGRPEIIKSSYPNLWEPSELCPPIHNHHLLPHENDCSKFYYCEYGMKRIDSTDCAPGTLFSYEKQVCVHPWDADCGNQPGPAAPVDTPAPTTDAIPELTYPNLWEPSDLCPPIHVHHLIPHETDCSKFYYCEYGLKRIDPTDCAPGTLFSYDEQVCVHPRDATCNQPGPAPPVDTTAPTTDAVTEITYPNLWEPSDLCPPIHVHHLIPHETDCSKFYYCEYGLKRIDPTDCAPGTLFSYEKQVCVHPRDADCNQPGPSPPVDIPALPTEAPAPPTEAPVPPTDAPAPPTVAPAQTTYPNLWEPSDLCPPIHVHHLIPHETDCSKFYYCEYGLKRIDPTDCAPGTLFSYEEQVCVHPRDATCNQPGPAPPVDTTAPTTDAVPEITYPNLWEPSDLCPPIHVHHLIPHETDCSKFYYCEYGLKRIDPTDCAPGTLFSYEKQVCVHPRDADCNQPGPSPPVDIPALPTEAPAPPTEAPVPPTDAPAPPTVAPAQTTYPNLWEPSDLCPPIHVHHLIPHETDCSKFYYCEYGLKRIDPTDCAPGTLFSYEKQVCVHPRDADCNQQGPSVPVDTPAPPTDAPALPTEAPAPQTVAPAQTTYPNLWEPSDLCPPIHVHHLIPHETDCSKFYYCEYGLKRIDPTDCAPGTLFSYEKQVCVHPRDADCNQPGPSPPVDIPALPTEAPAPPTEAPVPPTDAPAPPTVAPAQTTYPNLWEPSDLCPPIHVHHLIPHETDCSKFYYCEYGLKRIDPTDCAPGTLFSYEKQVCVHPRDADCNQQGPSVPVDTPAPPTDAPALPTEAPAPQTVAPAQTTYPNLWEPSDLCPPIHVHHLIPHETDCSKFYYCEYGLKRIDPTDCAPGTLFSYEKQVCVHPRDADCNQPGPSPPVDIPALPTEAPAPPTEAPAPPTVAPAQTTYPNLWEPSDLCPPIHVHHLIPHETDCSKFYYCEYGLKRIDPTDCAPGTLFSYQEQVCVHPRDADCNLPGPTGPPNPSPTTIPTPGPSPTTTEEPCTTSPDTPPTDALVTDTPVPPTDSPVTDPPPPPTDAPVTNPPPSPTPTPTTPAPDCDCEDGGNDCEVDYDARCRDNCNILPWAHATDCDKFWRCEGDKAVRVVCAEGLHFNPSTGSCDFICNAGCVRRHTTTTTYSDGLKIFVPFSEINGASTGLQSRIQRAIEHAKIR